MATPEYHIVSISASTVVARATTGKVRETTGKVPAPPTAPVAASNAAIRARTVRGSPSWLVVETIQNSEKQQADEAGARSSTTARPAQVGSDLPTTKAKLPCAVWLTVSWKALRPLLFHHPECIDQRDASGRR